MSKAEERAMEAYPVVMGTYSDNCREYDMNESDRLTYQEGYEQAVKDMIERTTDWLLKNFPGITTMMYIEDFKKEIGYE